MIADAFAAGKRGNTTAAGPEFKKKNHKGRSYKHVDGDRISDGGSNPEGKNIAKSMHKKGTRPGVGGHDRQAPHKQREHKEMKHVDQGQIVNEWVQGKRKDYK